MSEENKPVVDETVSEDTTNEVSTESTDVGALIAESKKYRKRSQEAEARLADLEAKLSKVEEDKLKEKEDFKALYEKATAENESLSANAEKWNIYEEAKRESLLESVPEEEREAMSKLDLATLEFVTNKINSSKQNAPVVTGDPKPKVNKGKIDFSDTTNVRRSWKDIVNSYKE